MNAINDSLDESVPNEPPFVAINRT